MPAAPFSFVQSENSEIRLHYSHQRLAYNMVLSYSWFSALSVGLCRLRHFLQVAAEQCDLERPWKSLKLDILITTLKMQTAPKQVFCKNIEQCQNVLMHLSNLMRNR